MSEKQKKLRHGNGGDDTDHRVLIGLVLIFKTQITELTGTVFEKISADSSEILS